MINEDFSDGNSTFTSVTPYDTLTSPNGPNVPPDSYDPLYPNIVASEMVTVVGGQVDAKPDPTIPDYVVAAVNFGEAPGYPFEFDGTTGSVQCDYTTTTQSLLQAYNHVPISVMYPSGVWVEVWADDPEPGSGLVADAAPFFVSLRSGNWGPAFYDDVTYPFAVDTLYTFLLEWQAGTIVTSAVPAKTRWRIRIQQSNGFPLVDIASIEMASSVGGSDICTGGTASAASADGSHPATHAFDSNAATYCQNGTGMGTLTHWIEYEFPSPVSVVEYRIQAAASASAAPKGWQLEYWTGTFWLGVDQRYDQTGWASGEVRTYGVSDIVDDVTNDGWVRLTINGDVVLEGLSQDVYFGFTGSGSAGSLHSNAINHVAFGWYGLLGLLDNIQIPAGETEETAPLLLTQQVTEIIYQNSGGGGGRPVDTTTVGNCDKPAPDVERGGTWLRLCDVGGQAPDTTPVVNSENWAV